MLPQPPSSPPPTPFLLSGTCYWLWSVAFLYFLDFMLMLFLCSNLPLNFYLTQSKRQYCSNDHQGSSRLFSQVTSQVTSPAAPASSGAMAATVAQSPFLQPARHPCLWALCTPSLFAWNAPPRWIPHFLQQFISVWHPYTSHTFISFSIKNSSWTLMITITS